MTTPLRPNTIEEWYLDALAFIRARYRYLPQVEIEEIEGLFAVRIAVQVARGKFDPSRGQAFTFLCWQARASAAYHRSKKRWKRCLMTSGLDIRRVQRPMPPRDEV